MALARVTRVAQASAMDKYHVYGIGAALVDTEIEVSDADLSELEIDKGVMTLAEADRQAQLVAQLRNHLTHSRRASGGSGANSIIGASYFGASCFYSCKVSDDENGDFYLADMKAAGVTCNTNDQRHEGVTGKCLVMITPDAQRTMVTHLGISATLSPAELDLEAAKSSQYVYLEGYLVSSESGRAAAIKLRETAQAHGVKTSISLSDPFMVKIFSEGLREMIGDRVDLLFCNEDEARGFTGKTDLRAAAQALQTCAHSFAITRGAQGALVFDGTNYHEVAPHPVKAVDTNGAGDMFAGAFLYAITHGHDFATAGRLASRASAEVVADYGPRLAPARHAAILAEVLG